MKTTNWRLVGRGGRSRAAAERRACVTSHLRSSVLRATLAGSSQGSRLHPALVDRLDKLTTFVHAAVLLNPIRFGGSYDRA